ncbi:MAG: hypothetical protein JNM79_23270 [Burkholderiales bacterium]|nr:hypothetical protein [Burkholderiales bacterium]
MLKKLLGAIAIGVAATATPVLADGLRTDEASNPTTSEIEKANPAPSDGSAERDAEKSGEATK